MSEESTTPDLTAAPEILSTFIEGWECHARAEVRAEQVRARDRDRPEAVTHYLSVEGWL